MTVAIILSDTFEQIKIEGDLRTLLGELNLAAAAGKQYVISRDTEGDNILIDRTAIKLAREVNDAYIGRS